MWGGRAADRRADAVGLRKDVSHEAKLTSAAAQAASKAESFQRLYKTEARLRAAAEQKVARESVAYREEAAATHERVRKLEDELITVQRKAPTMQQTVVARRYLGLPV